MDEAIECYQRAANLFKMAKKWSQAGKAFCECANLHLKSSGRLDAATNYIDASNCFKKSEPNGYYKLFIIFQNTIQASSSSQRLLVAFSRP